MRRALAKHGSTIPVAVVASALTAAAPSVAAGVRAAFASNSDKVDGIHAVTAKQAAKPAKRKGTLVATDTRTGLLPRAILPVQDSVVNATNATNASNAANAVNATNAVNAGHATSADTATSAADAARIAGLAPAQLTLTKVDAFDSTATLDTSPAATVSFTAPSAGYVTWQATCEFISVTPNVQADLRTTSAIDGGGETWRAHRTNLTNAPFNIQTVTATDWVAVAAGQAIVVGAYATAASSGADITCKNGRVVATYSATTTEG